MIRSLVSCGIESAAPERFSTSETVAGENPRRSANSFWLIGLCSFCGLGRVVLLFWPLCGTERSLAYRWRSSKRFELQRLTVADDKCYKHSRCICAKSIFLRFSSSLRAVGKQKRFLARSVHYASYAAGIYTAGCLLLCSFSKLRAGAISRFSPRNGD